jgi:hypothetical protein
MLNLELFYSNLIPRRCNLVTVPPPFLRDEDEGSPAFLGRQRRKLNRLASE